MSYDHGQGMETVLIFHADTMKAISKLCKKYKAVWNSVKICSFWLILAFFGFFHLWVMENALFGDKKIFYAIYHQTPFREVPTRHFDGSKMFLG